MILLLKRGVDIKEGRLMKVFMGGRLNWTRFSENGGRVFPD
jgi:hypothetical protein